MSGKDKYFLEYFQSSDIDDDEKKSLLKVVHAAASELYASPKRNKESPDRVFTDGNSIDWLHIHVQDNDGVDETGGGEDAALTLRERVGGGGCSVGKVAATVYSGLALVVVSAFSGA